MARCYGLGLRNRSALDDRIEIFVAKLFLRVLYNIGSHQDDQAKHESIEVEVTLV